MTLKELYNQHSIHNANQHEISLQILSVLNKLYPKPSSGECGSDVARERSLLEELSDQADERQNTTELLESILSHLTEVIG